MKSVTRRYMRTEKRKDGEIVAVSINPAAKVLAIEFDLEIAEDVDGNEAKVLVGATRMVRPDGKTVPNVNWNWNNAQSLLSTGDWMEVPMPPPPAAAPVRLAAEFDVPATNIPESGSW